MSFQMVLLHKNRLTIAQARFGTMSFQMVLLLAAVFRLAA